MCATPAHTPLRCWLYRRTAIPAFVAYKRNEKKVKSGYYKTKEEEQASWNKLHDKWAPKAYDLIVKLEGIYLKVAQIHGSRADMVHSTSTLDTLRVVYSCTAVQLGTCTDSGTMLRHASLAGTRAVHKAVFQAS